MIGNKSKENNSREKKAGEKYNNRISPILPAQGNNMFSCQSPMEVLLRIKIHTPQTHTQFLVFRSGHLGNPSKGSRDQIGFLRRLILGQLSRYFCQINIKLGSGVGGGL